MAISFAGVGTSSGSAGLVTSVSPTLPGDFVTNDMFICVLWSDALLTWTFPAGWTKKIDLGANQSQFVVAWKRAVIGDTTPTITCTGGGPTMSRIGSFRGVITAGDPFDAFNSQATASSATVTAPAITPLALDYIIYAGGQGAGVNTAGTFSGYAATNPSNFIEAFQSNANSASGPNDVRVFLAYAAKSDLVSTGNATATSTLTEPNAGGLLALTPASSVGDTLYNHVSVGNGMSRSEVAN